MSQIPKIKDTNNKYYAGMTLNDAKLLGIEKSFWHRDFHNIDKDKNGILSVEEIMAERKRSSNSDKVIAGIFAAWGVIDALTTKSKGWLAAGLAFDALVIFNCLSRAKRNDKQTKEYERIIRENNIDKYA